MKLACTSIILLLSVGALAQSNIYPTTEAPTIYGYSPGLILQRNTASGGYTQGIQTKLQNGTNSWFFGNLHDSKWIVSRGDYQFPKFTVEENGNVGIGTEYSKAKLNINSSGSDLNGGNVDIDANALVLQATIGSRSTTIGPKIEFAMPVNSDGTNTWSLARLMAVAGNSSPGDATGKMVFGTRRYYNKLGTGSQWYFGDDLVIDGTGNVGVGTLTPNEKLAVNGKIRAREIKVEPNPATWPDYVFEEAYPIGALEELALYIKANKHLPEMPTAKEVGDNGVELGEMNRLLLKKVEELTLHLIKNNETVTSQSKQLKIQEERINKLEEALKSDKKK